ncbi:MAG: metalloregulator ArsR/SmtB family transcription factor [Pseudomonadota bacterium]
MTNATQTTAAARALAALGHEARLDLYRLLVRAGPDGLIVGELAELTGLPGSTLSHHLRTLVSARLVRQARRGREVVNRADFDTMTRTLSFLTDQCCQGISIVSEDAA